MSAQPVRYRRVCLESFGVTLPEEVVTTAQVEQRLAPLYSRLKLPEGRLELMSGIRERRFFPAGELLGQFSVKSAEQAIQASGIDRREIGAIINGSVCRDYLEPATACGIHHQLGLSSDCLVMDISNACLGVLSGMLQVANMIELGQIRAGLVVGTECGRSLVEKTIAMLNADESLTRNSIKNSVASLTIGSGSVAVLLCDEELTQTNNRLIAAAVHAESSHHGLCQSRGLETVMDTDSETLMRHGIAAAASNFSKFLKAAEWTVEDINKTICHQVGTAHSKMMFQSLGLDPAIDFTTLETLGNTGAVALPMTMAKAIEAGRFEAKDKIAMLGIGSGINCQMLAVEWQH